MLDEYPNEMWLRELCAQSRGDSPKSTTAHSDGLGQFPSPFGAVEVARIEPDRKVKLRNQAEAGAMRIGLKVGQEVVSQRRVRPVLQHLWLLGVRISNREETCRGIEVERIQRRIDLVESLHATTRPWIVGLGTERDDCEIGAISALAARRRFRAPTIPNGDESRRHYCIDRRVGQSVFEDMRCGQQIAMSLNPKKNTGSYGARHTHIHLPLAERDRRVRELLDDREEARIEPLEVNSPLDFHRSLHGRPNYQRYGADERSTVTSSKPDLSKNPATADSEDRFLGPITTLTIGFRPSSTSVTVL